MKPGASEADIRLSVLNSSSRLPGFAFISTIDLIAIRPLHGHCAEATAIEGLAAYLMFQSGHGSVTIRPCGW